MKRIISLILMFIVIVGTCNIVSASEDYSSLRALGILPQEISESNSDEIITREVFAYMAAKMVAGEDREATNTMFADVDETNKFSGYINYLVNCNVISGSGNGNFNPQDNLTVDAAYKILTTILGYGSMAEKLGGYPLGYGQIASDIKLNKGIVFNGEFLTKGGAVKLINNALYAPMASTEYISLGENIISNTEKNKEKTIINDVLGMSVYDVYIDDVNQRKMAVSVTVLNSGEKISFVYKNGVNVAEFRYAPATIIVDEDNIVCGIYAQKEIEIKLAVIDGVNGNKSANTPAYNPKAITRLTLLDAENEFDVAEDVKIYYNEKLTEAPVSLIGKCARLVINKGEIVSIESWDLKEGGLISSSSEAEIVYTRGENADMKLKNLDLYKEKYIYIDGRAAGEAEIKPNSVFDYYLGDDTAVIVVSERMIVEKLYSQNASSLEIGYFIYPRGEKLYLKTGDGGFKEEADFKYLLGNDVKAYIAPNGKVLYLENVHNIQKNEVLFGVVKGYETDNLDDNVLSLKVLSLKPDIKEGIYEITKKTTLYDGVTRESLKAASGMIQTDYVFEFEINKEGKIVSVRNAKGLLGYNMEKTERTVTSFINDATAVITMNGKPLYFRGVPLTFIYDDEANGVSAKNVNWSSVYGEAHDATIAFYVFSENEEGSVPDLVLVLSKNFEPQLFKQTIRWGVVSEKELAIDENGDVCYEITVKTGGDTCKYYLSEQEAEGIKVRSFLTYYEGTFKDKDKIEVTNNIDLSRNPDEWAYVSGYGTVGMHKGTVVKTDGYRLWVKESDGTVDTTFYHPFYNFFIEIDTTKPTNSINNISENDITEGDFVFYNVVGDGIRGVFVIR